VRFVNSLMFWLISIYDKFLKENSKAQRYIVLFFIYYILPKNEID
jgi:hypothetical protein